MRWANVITNEYDLNRLQGHVYRYTASYFLFVLTHIAIIDLLQARPTVCLNCKDKSYCPILYNRSLFT